MSDGANKVVAVYRFPDGGTVTVTAPEGEAEWLRLLFERNPKPFKALRDIGYRPAEREDMDA